MENIALVFDTKKNELRITIRDETLIIDGFQKDVNEKYLRWLGDKEQIKIIKKFVNNLSPQ